MLGSSRAEDKCVDSLLVINSHLTLRITAITKPIRIRRKPTGRVKNINQIYPPVPLPSSHIDPPWKMEVTKARSKGEIAKIRPTRIKGKRLIRLPQSRYSNEPTLHSPHAHKL